MDEAGRSLGLVDIARKIIEEVVKGTRRRAMHYKIVLAGTGLDDIDEDLQELTGRWSSPRKWISPLGLFKQLFESQHIKEEEVLKGTISSVLAENEMRATIVRVRRSVSQEFTTN